jgi:hypothetical protein
MFPWTSLLWRCLPKDIRSCLTYTDELCSNLFISLPHATKCTFVANARNALQYPIFIETGTYLGDMAFHASRLFPRVHTIELSPALAKRATERFAGDPNVTVHQGDSGQILRKLLPTVHESCVFWLDGHYSGGSTARGATDTPILAELEAIAQHEIRPHAILIDDARVFGPDSNYPELRDVLSLLQDIDPDFYIGVCSDIIWAARVRLLRFEWQLSPSGLVLTPRTSVRW